MTSSLWVFGDSFSESKKPTRFPWSAKTNWVEMLSSRLGCYAVNFSRHGSSIEFATEKFYQEHKKIVSGDIIIFTFTHCMRKHIPNKPSGNNYYKWLNDGIISQEEYDFYTRWLEEMVHPAIEHRHQINFLYTLQEFQRKTGVRVIILPCWPIKTPDKYPLPSDIHIADGNLVCISQNEFKKKYGDDFWVIPDFRTNHMHTKNHEILFEKVYNHIINGMDIDLNTGFFSGLYDVSNIQVEGKEGYLLSDEDFRAMVNFNQRADED